MQECRRALAADGRDYTYQDLTALAADELGDGPLLDMSKHWLLSTKDMPAAIRAACPGLSPDWPGALIRCCLDSLAAAYSLVIRDLERLIGRPIDVLHIVGGGSNNALLNRLTADACGRTVIAGPAEATAAGNILCQLVGAGEVAGWDEARAICRNSFQPVIDIPSDSPRTVGRTHRDGQWRTSVMSQQVILIASGDLRSAANQQCEAAQATMESQIFAAFEREGALIRRGHPFDPVRGHGFIDSQKYGMEIFRTIPKDAPLVVAEAVWQYSHHVLAGLSTHRGPILTLANWSGAWPGLVGMLNLNGSLTKAGVTYSTLWSEDFTDDFFCAGLRQWLSEGVVTHDLSHVRAWDAEIAAPDAVEIGAAFGRQFKKNKAIMGVFDEGCMGMYNAIVPDELLHQTGVFKERLSQSALYAAMLTVTDEEADAVYQWLLDRGMTFHLGPTDENDLTEAQALDQCCMYVAALRVADEFGCDTIGIQYQQGLKDLAPASDLAEGLLNNVVRPPVTHPESTEVLYDGEALPHFNEVDECAGLDGLVTYRLWRQLGYAPETTLHDLRWGRAFQDDYVWVFEISGAAPPEHYIGGYAGTHSYRQPPMYFHLGGGTVTGVSKPGSIVWSRVFVEDDRLKMDIGLGKVVALPEAETQERLSLTTPQWPIMHAVLDGVTRDQMMARHKANHIQVVYAPTPEDARRGFEAKAAAMTELGVEVTVCGV